MKTRMVLLVVLMLFVSTPVRADLKQGMSAYDRGDYVTAFKELKAAAEQGDAEAQMMLGILYAEGEGTLQNYVEAHKWFNLSAAHGHAQARNARDKVAEKMTPEQIATAQRLAREWRQTATARELETAAPKPSVVQPEAAVSASREEKREIQQILAALGYDPGVADGLIGARTRSAIRSYQRKVGLPADGQASKALLERLKEDQNSLRVTSVTPESRPVAGGAEKPEDVQVLIDRVKRLAQEAEQKGAAQRWVLDELYTLVRQYDWPWKMKIVEDSFSDGDYTSNPTWAVAAGQFVVDKEGGLRSIVTIAPPEEENREVEPEDIAVSLLQSFLKQSSDEEEEAAGSPEDETYAEIHISANISNAFAISVTMVSKVGNGLIEFGPYQGSNRDTGYRLAYSPGAEGGLELLGVSSYRSAVVDLYEEPLKLEDGRSHTLLWTRDENGEMIISVDGKELLRVTDRRFGKEFGGFTLLNRGGDYGVQNVSIFGSKM